MFITVWPVGELPVTLNVNSVTAVRVLKRVGYEVWVEADKTYTIGTKLTPKSAHLLRQKFTNELNNLLLLRIKT